MYFQTSKITDAFRTVLNEDKTAKRKVVAYEWHCDPSAISAFDEGLYETWKLQIAERGFVYSNTKTIDFEGFSLKRIVYRHPTKLFEMFDPLSVALGYLKANCECVIYEVDHSEK